MTKLATEAGIPLVYVNRMPADSELPEKVAFVGSDERQSGTLEMQEVCKLMGGKGKILVMMGELSNQAARQRTQDVHDVIATPDCSGITIIEEQTGNWSRTQGTDLMTNWISAGHQFDAVVSNNDEMAIGAIQALKAAGVDMDKVIVAGVDATQDALAAMKAGELDVTVFQNAAGQGQGAVDTALKLAKGEQVESFVWVPFELVTPANMEQYVDQELTPARGRRAGCGLRPATAFASSTGRRSAWRSASNRAVRRAATRGGDDLLAVEGIRKEFPGVVALDNVQFRLQARHRACADGRERRRQVDADEDHRRHLPPRRRHDPVCAARTSS